MTLHFLHVGKTGGTAIKRALRKSGLPETSYGPIELHRHRFRMPEVPPDDFFFFCIRDPVARFLSGYYSRQNKGQPRYYSEWTDGERAAFEAFPTPQRLADALAGDDEGERRLAESAMRSIRHLRFMHRYVGTPKQLEARRDHIVYIGRQETLATDWHRLKAVLGLPDNANLPSNPVRAHRLDPSRDKALDDSAVRALQEWYAGDYDLVRYCDRVRAEQGWGPVSDRQRLQAQVRRWARTHLRLR
jgi:Sulfotransferase family